MRHLILSKICNFLFVTRRMETLSSADCIFEKRFVMVETYLPYNLKYLLDIFNNRKTVVNLLENYQKCKLPQWQHCIILRKACCLRLLYYILHFFQMVMLVDI